MVTNKPATPKNQQLISPIAKTHGFSLEQAPSKALKGTITSMIGSIEWQSRVATEPATLVAPVELQQGEQIMTGVNGGVSIDFPNAVSLVALPNTQLNFVQTLPDNVVILQTSGKSEYTSLGTSPITLRTFGLLSKLNDAKISVSIDDTDSLVTIGVLKGSITAAYNDTDFVSQVLTTQEGETLKFDSATKTAVVE